ncbi:MAG: hypothetical protein HY929_01815 [Euryarchaeota archaeon]|nr:hypothetical protein [Euryarchaeota archaeon]
MKLGVFISDFRVPGRTIDRLNAEKLGIFLVSNGILHAVIKENGKTSPLLEKGGAKFYVLSEDLQTRGFTDNDVDKKVNIVTYNGLVDLIMNEYEKLAWL